MTSPKMTFSGNNLLQVRDALMLALGELHNQIATCPDVDFYEDDIEALEAEQLRIKKLVTRINVRLGHTGESP